MVYVPPSQSATKKPRARSSAPKANKYKNQKVMFRGMKFDSIGERDRYVFLLSEQEAGRIIELERQVKYPLMCNGVVVCHYIAYFVYKKLYGEFTKNSDLPKGHGDPFIRIMDYNQPDLVYLEVVEDFKGQITDVFALKAKMFKACYGFDITITRRPSWRSSNVMEGKSWKHS